MGNYNNVATGSINAVNMTSGVKIGNHNDVAWFLSGDYVAIGHCNSVDQVWYNYFYQ